MFQRLIQIHFKHVYENLGMCLFIGNDLGEMDLYYLLATLDS